MARPSIKDKIAQRGSRVTLTNYATKYGWYYIRITEEKIKVIQTEELDLDHVIKDIFGAIVPNVVPLTVRDVFLFTASTSADENQQPSVYIKNAGYYGDSIVGCLIDRNVVSNVQPIPFSLAISTIEGLRFPKKKLPIIEVTPIN